MVKKKKTSGFETMRQASAATKTTSTMPEISLSGKVATACRELIADNQQIKNLKARITNNESIVFPVAQKVRIEKSKELGKLFASVRLFVDNIKATFTQQGVFLKMTEPEKSGYADKLQAEFTNDFDKYFNVIPGISSKDEFTINDANKIIKALGSERAQKVLNFVETIVPTEILVTDMVFDDNVAKKIEEIKQQTGLLKMKKASIRTGN